MPRTIDAERHWIVLAVRDALVNRYGIAPRRLTAKSHGLTRPVETNATTQGRARNWRVELSRPCAAH
jgi:OmpA-OmpF porin, OOP family